MAAMNNTTTAQSRETVWTHRTATVDGVDLHYVQAGDQNATPLVLVHGWPETWYAWRKVIPALAQHYRVYAVDLPGLGDSAALAEPGIRTAAALLDRWREQLGLGAVHVVGHDLGGMTSYAWAAQQREEIRSLSVLGVPLHGFGLQEFINRAGLWHFGLFAVPGLTEHLADGRERLLLTHFYEHIHAADAVTETDVDAYLRSYGRPGGLGASLAYYRNYTADTEAFTEYGRRSLAIPVLGVGGDHAGGPIPEISLAQVADDVRGSVLTDCGHFLAEEQPEQLTDVLLDFLTAVDNKGTAEQ